MQKFDIWSQWLRPMVMILKDGNPVIEGFVYIYVDGEKGLADETITKMYRNHGEATKESKYEIRNDMMINLLYFAAMRANTGIKMFGLGTEEIVMDAAALAEMAVEIDQLATIFAYNTNLISQEHFVQDFKNHKLFFSTLRDDNDTGAEDGGAKFYACSATGNPTLYYPMFFTPEHMHDFFKLFNRTDYPVLESDLEHFLPMLDVISEAAALGVVIEPLNNFNVALAPGFRLE